MKETVLCLCCQSVFPRQFFFSFFFFMNSVSSHTPLLCFSAGGSEVQRIEEMEKMLKEAQQEKARLVENRVSSRS